MKTIRIIGKKADGIKEGQIFKVILNSVKGHDIFILEPVWLKTQINKLKAIKK